MVQPSGPYYSSVVTSRQRELARASAVNRVNELAVDRVSDLKEVGIVNHVLGDDSWFIHDNATFEEFSRKVLMDLILRKPIPEIANLFQKIPETSGFVFGILKLEGQLLGEDGLLINSFRFREMDCYSYGGREGIKDKLASKLSEFDMKKRADGTVPGSDKNSVIQIVSFQLGLFMISYSGGATSQDENGVEDEMDECFMKLDHFYGLLDVAKLPKKMVKSGFWIKTDHACFLRCLRYCRQDKGIKWPSNYEDLLVTLNLPNSHLTPDQCSIIAKHFNINLRIYIYDPNVNITSCVKYEYIIQPYDDVCNMVLKEGHYFVLTNCVSIKKAKKRNRGFDCLVCGKFLSWKELFQHNGVHDMERMHEERTLDLELAKRVGSNSNANGGQHTSPDRGVDESFEDFCARHNQWALDSMLYYMDYRQNNRDFKLMFLSGAGGCGKTQAVRMLMQHCVDELHFEKEDFLIVAFTGLVSQSLGGVTVDSFLWKRVADDRKPKMVIVDEVSLLDKKRFDRFMFKVNEVISDKHGKFCGNLPVLILGDYMQSKPIFDSADGQFSFQSIYFKDFIPLHFNYPFRFEGDLRHQKVLEKIRIGLVPSSTEWESVGYKYLTESEVIFNFTMNTRPPIITHLREIQKEYCRKAHIYEQSISSVPQIRVQTKFYRDVDGTVQEFVPDSRDVEMFEKEHFNFLCNESIHVGEVLRVTKNNVAVNGDRKLKNGHYAYFQGFDAEGKMQLLYDGDVYILPALEIKVEVKVKKQLIKQKAFVFPVISGVANTIHSAQGQTLDSVVIDIMDKYGYNLDHLFYTAMSRVRNGEKLYFVVGDECVNQSQSERARWYRNYIETHSNRFGYVPVCMEMMKNGKVPSTGFDEDGEEIVKRRITISSTKQRYWKKAVPKPFPMEKGGNHSDEDVKQHEFDTLFDFSISFDVETGARSDFANHVDYFDENGNLLSPEGNSTFLPQDWYAVGAYITFNRATYWFPKDCEFSQYQKEDGSIQIFSSVVNECKEIFFDMVLYMARYKREWLLAEKIKVGNTLRPINSNVSFRDRAPITLMTFNGDAFDIHGFMAMVTSRHWGNDISIKIVPNSGSSFTNMKLYGSLPQYKRKKVGVCLVSLHDITRIIGKFMSLTKAHKAYVKSFTDTAWDAMVDTIKCQHLKNFIQRGRVSGKDKFPHLLLRRYGGRIIEDQNVVLRREDFPERDRGDVTEEDLKMNLKDHLNTYLTLDVATMMGLYLGFQKMSVDGSGISCLKYNTAAQFTTFSLLLKNLKSNWVSEVTDLSQDAKRGSPNLLEVQTLLPIFDKKQNDILRSAMFGGRTKPNIRHWSTKDERNDFYCQVDMSGMYAYIQATSNFGFGAFMDCGNSPTEVQRLWDLWTLAKELDDPFCISDPDHLDREHNCANPFRHVFLARCLFKYPSLHLEPGIPCRDRDGNLYHAVWHEESSGSEILEKGQRLQWLDNFALATLLMDGGELLKIDHIYQCSQYGKVLSSYITECNQQKAQAKIEKNEPKEADAKLRANALYGASLKQHKLSRVKVLNPERKDEFEREMDEFSDDRTCIVNANGTITVIGEIEQEPDFSERSTFIGIMVLTASRFYLNRTIKNAYNLNWTKMTKSMIYQAIFNQCLYGDTDSLYLRHFHIMNLVKADRLEKYDHLKFLYYAEGVDKMCGRFTDERADNHNKTNWEEKKCCKVLEFASCAPKSYTDRALNEDGLVVYKNKFKGVANGALLELIDEDGVVHMRANMDPKSKQCHELLLRAMTSNFSIVSSKETLKKTGFNPPTKRLRNNQGGVVKINNHELGVTSLTRQVCRDTIDELRWRGRRLMTLEEARFLNISADDAWRLLVPIGWNYDGLLFELVD